MYGPIDTTICLYDSGGNPKAAPYDGSAGDYWYGLFDGVYPLYLRWNAPNGPWDFLLQNFEIGTDLWTAVGSCSPGELPHWCPTNIVDAYHVGGVACDGGLLDGNWSGCYYPVSPETVLWMECHIAT